MSPIKIVLDTNVLVAGLRSNSRASHSILRLLGSGSYDLCISVALILEYEEVLKNKINHEIIFSKEIEEFIDYLCKIGKKFNIHFLWRPTLRDPDDEMVLEIAVSSQAEFIVTFNVKDFIRENYFGVKVITPIQFLKKIGGEKS